jgi:hypothetical protein
MGGSTGDQRPRWLDVAGRREGCLFTVCSYHYFYSETNGRHTLAEHGPLGEASGAIS